MADVQTENGFTKIANELLDVVMRQKFNGTQFKIIMAVWRFTYGFSRKEHEMSLTFLSKATGMHKQQIKTELAKLIDDHVILVTGDPSYTTSRKLSFNKNYDEWKNIQSANQLPVSESTYTTVSESTTTTVSESTYQERNIKENIKEIEEEEYKANPFNFYEQNGFGLIPPFVIEEINYWIDSGKFDHPKLIIIEALKESVVNNVRKWNYTNKILMNWSNDNLRTLNEVRSHMIDRQLNRKDRSDEKNRRSTRIIPEDEFDHLSF